MADEVVKVVIDDEDNKVIVTPVKTDPEFVIVNEGTAGPRGPQGTPGPAGPGGGSGLDVADVAFVFTQGEASDTWLVVHPLAYQPNVTVVDSAGTEQMGSVRYSSQQLIVITFSGAFSGTAYLS